MKRRTGAGTGDCLRNRKKGKATKPKIERGAPKVKRKKEHFPDEQSKGYTF